MTEPKCKGNQHTTECNARHDDEQVAKAANDMLTGAAKQRMIRRRVRQRARTKARP